MATFKINGSVVPTVRGGDDIEYGISIPALYQRMNFGQWLQTIYLDCAVTLKDIAVVTKDCEEVKTKIAILVGDELKVKHIKCESLIAICNKLESDHIDVSFSTCLMINTLIAKHAHLEHGEMICPSVRADHLSMHLMDVYGLSIFADRQQHQLNNQPDSQENILHDFNLIQDWMVTANKAALITFLNGFDQCWKFGNQLNSVINLINGFTLSRAIPMPQDVVDEIASLDDIIARTTNQALRQQCEAQKDALIAQYVPQPSVAPAVSPVEALLQTIEGHLVTMANNISTGSQQVTADMQNVLTQLQTLTAQRASIIAAGNVFTPLAQATVDAINGASNALLDQAIAKLANDHGAPDCGQNNAQAKKAHVVAILTVLPNAIADVMAILAPAPANP